MQRVRPIRMTGLVSIILLAMCSWSFADADLKLSPRERAAIRQQFGAHLPYHVSLSRSSQFPEVLRVMQYDDDAGYFSIGTLVDGVWAVGSTPSTLVVEISSDATRRVLQRRGWPTLTEDERKSLALRWVEDSLPPGFGSQTAELGGHPPEVLLENGDVVVRIWLAWVHTTIAGPRGSRNDFATVFRIAPDGSMSNSQSPGGAPRP